MMDVDECMRKATEAYDRIVTDAMTNAVEMMHTYGYPTEIEIEEFLKWYSELLASDRETTLARLRAFLERDGEPLQ
jgi:hypothetical protein